ncbi:MAG: cytidylate kinase family protein, partial [Lachnospiraceae bacterium]|nr:cytidylate kinase family protein [Lachnospiraceae bacterium]
MDKIVITIARYYGSGGKTIGEMLAKDLGIEYYEKDLEVLAAEESGINEALFVDFHDKTKSFRSFLNNGLTVYK